MGIGPDRDGGIVLSGHSDVGASGVGQPWTCDPFTLRDGGDRFGRGTSDMKGFIALAL